MNTPSTVWEYGTPGFAPLNTAYSGNYCWDVNLIGPYGNLAAAYLASPGFDLGTASEVLISCWENHRTEAFADGAFWEYSVNGQTWQRLGEVNDSLGSNWYNGPLYGGRSGWSGIGNGWTLASYRYKPAPGSTYLRLRMVFISDPSIIDAGFSLDDISITAVTGIAETNQDKQALIMPNPTSDLFQIEIPEVIQGIVVWDASGRKITEMTTTDVSNRFIGSAETWTEGTYIIRAQGKSGQLYSASLLVFPRK